MGCVKSKVIISSEQVTAQTKRHDNTGNTQSNYVITISQRELRDDLDKQFEKDSDNRMRCVCHRPGNGDCFVFTLNAEQSHLVTGVIKVIQTQILCQYISEAEAVQYVMTELETTETRARLMVKQVQTDDDSRISNQELTDLWGKVKDVKAEIRAEFRVMDLDNSGFVSPDEAVTVLERRFPGLPEESIRGIVRRYDTDDNGKMQYEEFIYFYCNMCAKRESLETDYEILAKENHGRLPAKELTELLRKQCVLDSYMARSLVDDCDINRDGIINKKEFTNLMNSMFGLNYVDVYCL